MGESMASVNSESESRQTEEKKVAACFSRAVTPEANTRRPYGKQKKAPPMDMDMLNVDDVCDADNETNLMLNRFSVERKEYPQQQSVVDLFQVSNGNTRKDTGGPQQLIQ